MYRCVCLRVCTNYSPTTITATHNIIHGENIEFVFHTGKEEITGSFHVYNGLISKYSHAMNMLEKCQFLVRLFCLRHNVLVCISLLPTQADKSF